MSCHPKDEEGVNDEDGGLGGKERESRPALDLEVCSCCAG